MLSRRGRTGRAGVRQPRLTPPRGQQLGSSWERKDLRHRRLKNRKTSRCISCFPQPNEVSLYSAMDPLPPNGPATDSAPEEPTEIEVLVRGSDEDIAQFNAGRIVEALVKEAGLDRDFAVQISAEVGEFIQKLGLRTLSSTLIRGLVDTRLLELG